MSEIGERLQRAMNDLAGVQLIDNTWQEAEVVRREITGIIQTLHRDLCAANADLREWEGLRFQIDQCKKSRERLKARAEAAEAGAALVPEAELLYSLSYCADGIVPVNAEAARALAADIRAWRGDGDGDGEEEG